MNLYYLSSLVLTNTCIYLYPFYLLSELKFCFNHNESSYSALKERLLTLLSSPPSPSALAHGSLPVNGGMSDGTRLAFLGDNYEEKKKKVEGKSLKDNVREKRTGMNMKRGCDGRESSGEGGREGKGKGWCGGGRYGC